jgi:hypothetical protein
MKNIIKVFVGLVILAGACDDNDSGRPVSIDGTYTGHFQRSTPTGDWMVANVSLELSDNTYSGGSDIYRYPAICHGTYNQEGAQITFADECVWTADFDWTLILSGTFEITVEEGKVRLTKKYNDEMFDQYTLTRQ